MPTTYIAHVGWSRDHEENFGTTRTMHENEVEDIPKIVHDLNNFNE
jgi:hypothetical protein